ncbi:cytidylyltransferase domain-containing protein [Campylobacter jejuni]|uniref:acylneuraminate cytidylyltransferase family protein n=1 Tax=Campylobacter jejuni TaxID=197 RepID=UPI000F806DAB|nr:acylneuraminate cytidylyltransferase family protein [Campylobacter jejuni]RTK09321.1 CMP-N-acetlyneuraminic acid synthetase [Campylobacter jejuni]HEF7931709.1 acylneuraminate cytidylyltransferase family protein [Campylobacter jejuni]
MVDKCHKRFLAVIPARSGSKRLKNKNIVDFCGKPLMAWSIEAAVKSEYIQEVVVSTDSYEYANIAKKFGATIPYLRPKELSLDTIKTFDVVEHVIKFYYSRNILFDYVVILQPTSPLRNFYHINQACKLCLEKSAHSIISVSECEHSPLWSNLIPDSLEMVNFLPKEYDVRSQDLPKYYRLNGAIAIAKIDQYLKYKKLFIPKSFAYIMDKNYSIDIDTQLDLDYAIFLFNRNLCEDAR